MGTSSACHDWLISAAGWVCPCVVTSVLAGLRFSLEVITGVARWYRRLPTPFADRAAAAARPTWVSPHGLVTDTAMAAISAISAQTRVASRDRGQGFRLSWSARRRPLLR